MHCPKCLSEAYSRNGYVSGVQRYRCKSCHCNFTRATPKGYPPRLRELSVLLYVFGLSMNAIATLLGVSHQTSYRWIKQAAKALPEPEIRHTVTEVEIDEMCLFLKKRVAESGFGKCFVADLSSLSPGMLVLAMRAS
jgi:transposase-like protein